MPDFSEFEKLINFNFQDRDLLREVFTHRSYINEHKEKAWRHNERLEFLGDAVLELVVTEYLFKIYPDHSEGELTSYRAALVNATTLGQIAERLKVNDYLLLSRGESKDTGKARSVILANTLEALIGAIYLDGGYRQAVEFTQEYILPRVGEIVSKRLWQDPKSRFQELAQEEDEITPLYKVLKESGPDHNKRFTVGVYLGRDLVAEGSGFSKREAEEEAARRALESKGWTSGRSS